MRKGKRPGHKQASDEIDAMIERNYGPQDTPKPLRARHPLFYACYDAAKKYGDWEALANCIKQGWYIPPDPEVRSFMADLMLGKVSRSANRPPSAATKFRDLEVAAFVAWRKRNRSRSPVKEATDIFRMDRTAVQDAVKAWPDEKALEFAIAARKTTWEHELQVRK